jgi:hypothetical protein
VEETKTISSGNINIDFGQLYIAATRTLANCAFWVAATDASTVIKLYENIGPIETSFQTKDMYLCLMTSPREGHLVQIWRNAGLFPLICKSN